MRWFGRLLGWFVIVDALITIFGEATGPLLLSFAADGAIGLLIIRSWMEGRAVTVPALAAKRRVAVRLHRVAASAPQQNGPGGGR